MTRAKTLPPMRKPVFDEEGVLRFAAMEMKQPADVERAAGARPADKPAGKSAKKSDPDRERLTLTLSAEAVGHLKAAADRKEKTVDQIVEKLVTKHLGKH